MITRRLLIGSGVALAGGGLVAAAKSRYPLSVNSLLESVDSINHMAENALLDRHALVRELDRSMITKNFPAINTIRPEPEAYHRSRALGFSDWRLPVTGLVKNPISFSLADLMAFPSRTQITQHNCVDGWSAVAEWKGVQIGRILNQVGLLPGAKYALFDCVDGWWDSYELIDMYHPQTLFTYGMNGGLLPMQHGAPVRLRIERQLGYKSLKFISAMRIVDRIDRVRDGNGSQAAGYGYQWHAGI
jgi:DMSO/TMAO reductase YedYZ molybdopterin-dependent catalytic subunit